MPRPASVAYAHRCIQSEIVCVYIGMLKAGTYVHDMGTASACMCTPALLTSILKANLCEALCFGSDIVPIGLYQD